MVCGEGFDWLNQFGKVIWNEYQNQENTGYSDGGKNKLTIDVFQFKMSSGLTPSRNKQYSGAHQYKCKQGCNTGEIQDKSFVCKEDGNSNQQACHNGGKGRSFILWMNALKGWR